MKKVLIYVISVYGFIISCNTEPNQSEFRNIQLNTRESSDPPLLPGEPVLGAILQNPYDIENMEAAYEQLTGATIQLTPTHYYLKFSPVNGEDIIELEEFEEKNGYEFETQPIHYEVLSDGKEDYIDPAFGEEGFSPEYGAILAEDYITNNLPAIPYEVLNVMYIPVYETRLTFTAFVISGNERYYEAVNGLCHPDCPSWPQCLEEASLTCQVGTTAYMPSIDPTSSDERVNFPGYILDGALGYNGEIPESSGRIPGAPYIPACPTHCRPIIAVTLIGNSWYWEWICDCDFLDDGDGDGGGGGPPAGQVERCGCFVYDNPKKAGGKISVDDTQKVPHEGVRRIKVKTAPKNFGFVWQTTDTDDNGCWKIDHAYNVKRLKIKAVFKDRISNRMVIRSFRGARFWNAFLKPVKHKFLETRANKEWHSLCLLLEDSEDNNSRDEQSYIAATTNNAVHEYYDDYSTMPSPGKIKILIHNLSDKLNSAPMFSEMDQDQFTYTDITNWFVAFSLPFQGLLYTYWQISKPDVFISFGDSKATDQKKNTVYHEMIHVSQYAVVGPDWWKQYVSYIFGIAITSQPKPYGDGSSNGSGRAELAEGMAFGFEDIPSDLEYGLLHSNGGFFPETDRFINNAEKRRFWSAANQFIPSGLFFDLFDENGVFPTSVSATEPPGINDPAMNFPFEIQVQVLGFPSIENIGQFKDALFQFHGPASGTSLNNYNALFQSYGH